MRAAAHFMSSVVHVNTGWLTFLGVFKESLHLLGFHKNGITEDRCAISKSQAVHIKQASY
jgi:hypothetical protein